jgi:uncharacterized membrane protein (DUF485 family)
MKIIETRLTEKEFINASMVLLYKKPIVWLFSFIGIIFLISFLLNFVPSKTPPNYVMPVFFGVLIGGMFPLTTYFKAKKEYNAHNSRIKEKIEYEFQDNQFIIRGESFNAQLSWDKIHKVTTTKKWLFIWQNSQHANAIPKKDIWKGELLKLREILDANKVKYLLQ